MGFCRICDGTFPLRKKEYLYCSSWWEADVQSCPREGKKKQWGWQAPFFFAGTIQIFMDFTGKVWRFRALSWPPAKYQKTCKFSLSCAAPAHRHSWLKWVMDPPCTDVAWGSWSLSHLPWPLGTPTYLPLLLPPSQVTFFASSLNSLPQLRIEAE